MKYEELEFPCCVCGAEPGQNCRDEEDLTVELSDGCFHVGRTTGGGPLTIQKEGDGTWVVLDN